MLTKYLFKSGYFKLCLLLLKYFPAIKFATEGNPLGTLNVCTTASRISSCFGDKNALLFFVTIGMTGAFTSLLTYL
jgi:hypothetical protein